MISPVLQACKENLHTLLKCKVLFDPQPIQMAEPHIRLTYTGPGDLGDDVDVINFQLSVMAAGDGPDVFLPQIITLSLAVHEQFAKVNPAYHLLTIGAKQGRLYFNRIQNASGQFIRNDHEESEFTQFRYTYVEPHIVTISFPRELR